MRPGVAAAHRAPKCRSRRRRRKGSNEPLAKKRPSAARTRTGPTLPMPFFNVATPNRHSSAILAPGRRNKARRSVDAASTRARSTVPFRIATANDIWACCKDAVVSIPGIRRSNVASSKPLTGGWPSRSPVARGVSNSTCAPFSPTCIRKPPSFALSVCSRALNTKTPPARCAIPSRRAKTPGPLVAPRRMSRRIAAPS